MLTIKVCYRRSEEFCQAEAIRSCDNVPREGNIMVELSAMPVELREVYCDGGKYTSWTDGIRYTEGFRLSCNSAFGSELFVIDAMEPTQEQVVSKMLVTLERVKARRAKYLTDLEAKAKEEERLAKEWAAFPLSLRASKGGLNLCKDPIGYPADSGTPAWTLDALKRHVPHSVDDAKAHAEALAKAAKMDELQKKWRTVSAVLSRVPDDVIKDAIKMGLADGFVGDPETDIATACEAVNDASLFELFDDPDSDEDSE